MLAFATAQVLAFTNKTDFETTRPLFVKFYMPWCDHCKAMQGAFEELADSVGDDFVIAEVNCQAVDFCASYAVRGYPTLAFYNYGDEISRYDGERTPEAMQRWLRDQLCIV